MKKIICILLFLTVNIHADYISSGIGSSKAEAYLNAMSAAPSGDHWVLKKISYAPSSGCRYSCNVVWEQK